MELQLFRIKAFAPPPSLFDQDFTPSEVLRQSLIAHPTSRPRRGVSWHVGNVQALDEHGYYFRIGRQSRASLPQLDTTTGDFIEAEFESAPYTHALVDVRLEVCALAPKYSLAPRVDRIAQRLAEVLTEGPVATRVRARFGIGALSDPDRFLELLRTAQAIKSFSFTFQRRNPFDVEELFIRPFERLVEATDAFVGNATVKGVALTETPLEAITRSVAATGDDARARLVIEPEAKAVVKTLRGSNVAISAETLDDEEEKGVALDRTRAEYTRIRGNDDG